MMPGSLCSQEKDGVLGQFFYRELTTKNLLGVMRGGPLYY
jgi:hypothetical protein